jgi:hypothetical protein
MPRNLPRNVPAATLIVAPTPSRPVQLIPNDTRSKNKIVKTAMIHLGRSIPLMCIRCGKTPERKPVDNRPAFCTISAATGKYIAQRQACRTPACNPKERKGQVDQFMVPQDPTIPYIRSDNLLKVEVPENS